MNGRDKRSSRKSLYHLPKKALRQNRLQQLNGLFYGRIFSQLRFYESKNDVTHVIFIIHTGFELDWI